VWSRGFATKEAKSLRDELEKRPQPELRCPECPNDEVVVGQKSADGAKIQRWFECRECRYESRSALVYGPER
jgi:transposase-like protein